MKYIKRAFCLLSLLFLITTSYASDLEREKRMADEIVDAMIDGDTVVVSSPRVAKPVAVRYAFRHNPRGVNFYNRAGLPASPFRTDNWK